MTRWIRESVFIKLLIILVGATALIDFFVLAGFRFLVQPHPQQMDRFHRGFEQHAAYLMKDLAKEPTLENAKKLTQNGGLNVRAEGALNWTTSQFPPMDSSHPENRGPRIRLFRFGPPHHPPVAHFDLKLAKGPTHFTFFGEPGPQLKFNWLALSILLSILSGIIALSYLLIRRLLTPVRSLAEGVSQLSRGNFEYEVKALGDDELGQLTHSFNQMAAQLREMIKAKERLLLDVSHELRTPLTRAKIALEMFPDVPLKSDLSEDVAEMELMVSEILEGARLNSPHGALDLSEVDLWELVCEVTRSFKGSEVALKAQKPETSVHALGDKGRLTTVIRNLVQNAVKYSASQSVELELTQDVLQTIIQVKDHGKGIPAADLERVFEPFYRVDKSRDRKTGGFGLGLSLCKKIIEAHGGSIRLSSEEGRGTTATVILPRR